MSPTINSGKRIAIALDGYAGPAGFTEFEDGTAAISFEAARSALRAGATIEADGRSWTVTKAGPSQFLRGYRTAELRLADKA